MRLGLGLSTVRRAALAAAIALGAFAGYAATPSSAAALSCSATLTGRYFDGTREYHSTTQGASAQIEYENPELCSTAGGATFSSYWVAIAGASDPNDILQVGIDKCKTGTTCGPGAPNNTPYYFWAYGRHASAGCGAGVGPVPVVISGTPNSGLVTYSIYKATVSGQVVYVVKKGGVQAVTVQASLVDGCWGGVAASGLLTEVFNGNTQSGGPNSNRQNWEQSLWRSSAGWNTITRAAGANCDDIDLPTQRCQWKADGSGVWYAWDTRWP